MATGLPPWKGVCRPGGLRLGGFEQTRDRLGSGMP